MEAGDPHSGSQGEGAAEEDGFLVVKRRDIFDAAPAPSAPAALETGEVILPCCQSSRSYYNPFSVCCHGLWHTSQCFVRYLRFIIDQ